MERPRATGDASSGGSYFRSEAARPTAALIALRIAYAYNWFDVGPGLLGIGSTFGVGPAGWGVVLASFLVGAGLVQVPAGFLARRWGARTVSLVGVTVLGVAGLGCAVAPSFGVLIALRAVGGFGAALFFSPAIGLVGELNPEGRRGVAIGTFSSAFSIGAALGVAGSALLVPLYGWRLALGFGGALVLALTLPAALAIPRDAGAGSSAPHRGREPARALRLASVWAMGFAFVGLEGASLSAGQYFVPYAVQSLGWGAGLAGGVAALFVFPSFFGGPVGGVVAERQRDSRRLMVVATAVSGLLVLGVPFAPFAELVALAIAFSFAYGAVYAMMYVIPRYLPGLPPSEIPLAIGLFNAIQIAGGASIAFGFGALVERFGYSISWELLGVLTLVPLVILTWVRVAPGPLPNASSAVASRPR